MSVMMTAVGAFLTGGFLTAAPYSVHRRKNLAYRVETTSQMTHRREKLSKQSLRIPTGQAHSSTSSDRVVE